MSSKLEIAKMVVKKWKRKADCGIFDSWNTVGDKMTNVYTDVGLRIDVCMDYRYLEVFGLSEEEFDELKQFYDEG